VHPVAESPAAPLLWQRTLESFRRKRSQAPPGRRRQKYPVPNSSPSLRCTKHSCAPAAASLPQTCRRSRPRECSQFVGIICAHFLDSRIIPARRFIAAHQQLNLGGNVRIHRRQGHRIQAASRFLLKSHDRRLGRSARDQAPCEPHAESAAEKDRRCMHIPFARRKPPAPAPCRNPLRRDFTSDSSTISEVEVRYSNKDRHSRHPPKARPPSSSQILIVSP